MELRAESRSRVKISIQGTVANVSLRLVVDLDRVNLSPSGFQCSIGSCRREAIHMGIAEHIPRDCHFSGAVAMI